VPDAKVRGRAGQKWRTRKDLLQAANRLLKQGRKPSLEDVAEEALVSRATAYRYFPGVEALLLEATLDVAVPDPDDLFEGSPDDPVMRLQAVDGALHRIVTENEAAVRLMLAQSLERRAAAGDGELPVRQNRRLPLIEAALEPSRDQFEPAVLKRLQAALSLIMGSEAMIVFRDVLQLDESRARDTKHWAIRALVEAALEESNADLERLH
jgi:AcrR family transcriptional regulator